MCYIVDKLDACAFDARMKQEKTMQMRIAAEYQVKLDELRKWEPDLPSRAEMVRRMIERLHAQGPTA